ncbi:hypothetical protein PZE06_05380 [Robertmurraya sp. DFI.2.37]|uniref:hypothetical protein n=1 Tax=Robertmurraya sp. DFI.2.37 TaxID=3031819 RepID=UPI001244CC60|nr:hypothetical protein [Robertmurraya sp. DFI.2.37]MDF1507612.1 hypothetical protein [Robertmurraya sp. DFI.2.37]
MSYMKGNSFLLLLALCGLTACSNTVNGEKYDSFDLENRVFELEEVVDNLQTEIDSLSIENEDLQYQIERLETSLTDLEITNNSSEPPEIKIPPLDKDIDNDGLWDYDKGGIDRDLDNDGMWDQ